MLRVGLTGGIAAGKSHVRKRFAAAGLATLDLDQVTHALLAAGGAGQQAVVAAFGADLLGPDGAVDRRRLGARVFADAQARARLDALLHPLIRVASERQAAVAQAAGASAFVTEAALLVETGGHLRFDRLVVVHCTPEQQLARLMARDGSDEAAARARLAAQMPIARKLTFAHLRIDSSGAPHATDARSDDVAHELHACAARACAARVPDALTARLAVALEHGPRQGPRGLHPERVIAHGAAGLLDLQALGKQLEPPPATGRWYEAARADEGEPGPEALAFVVAAWAQARRPVDEAFAAGAAVSLARLTHVAAQRVGLACLAAGVAWDLLATGTPPSESRVAVWRDRARSFDTEPPAPRLAFLGGPGAPTTPTEVALCAARDALVAGDDARAVLAPERLAVLGSWLAPS